MMQQQHLRQMQQNEEDEDDWKREGGTVQEQLREHQQQQQLNGTGSRNRHAQEQQQMVDPVSDRHPYPLHQRGRGHLEDLSVQHRDVRVVEGRAQLPTIDMVEVGSGRNRSRRRRSRKGDADSPYFERIQMDESMYLGKNEGQSRRPSEIDDQRKYPHDLRIQIAQHETTMDDLERRLENECCLRLEVEEVLQIVTGTLNTERAQNERKIQLLENQVHEHTVREEKLLEKVRHLERDLQRIHSKKHEMMQQGSRIKENEDREQQDVTGMNASLLPRRERSESRLVSSQWQDEAMAVAYFSEPSSAVAEEQHRVRMAQSLSHFFGI